MSNENEDFDVAALNAGLNGEEVEETPEVQDHENEQNEEQEEEPENQDGQDDEEQEEVVVSAKPAKPQSREQRLANERNKERAEKQAERESRLLAEQRAAILEQQLAEFRKGTQKVEDENLDPMEKWQRDANAAIQRTQFETRDMHDESKFLIKVSKNPELAKYQDAVEKRLQDARKNGYFPTRENVLEKILGEKAVAELSKVPALKREAAKRVEKAVGKPLGAKSNVAPSKQSESTEFDRLKGITL
jgi:hypothetical protein